MRQRILPAKDNKQNDYQKYKYSGFDFAFLKCNLLAVSAQLGLGLE